MLQPPNLPTDNLYKFITIIGLIVLIFCFVYPLSVIKDLSTQQYLLLPEIEKYNYEIYSYKYDSIVLDLKCKKAEKELKRYDLGDTSILREKISLAEIKKNGHSKDYREYFIFTNTYEKQLIPVIGLLEELDTLTNKLRQVKADIHIKTIELKYKKELFLEQVKDLKKWNNYLRFGSFWGLTVMLLGIYFWYFRVQRYQDKKLISEANEKKKEK